MLLLTVADPADPLERDADREPLHPRGVVSQPPRDPLGGSVIDPEIDVRVVPASDPHSDEPPNHLPDPAPEPPPREPPPRRLASGRAGGSGPRRALHANRDGWHHRRGCANLRCAARAGVEGLYEACNELAQRFSGTCREEVARRILDAVSGPGTRRLLAFVAEAVRRKLGLGGSRRVPRIGCGEDGERVTIAIQLHEEPEAAIYFLCTAKPASGQPRSVGTGYPRQRSLFAPRDGVLD